MKKISYIICLTAILCSCNNELPIENVQELRKQSVNPVKSQP